MTKTLETNGQTRKTLASQLDRLDRLLDGLAEGLNQANASAVKEAVGLAVQEAVQAVLTEVLTNPALREQLKAAVPEAAPPAEPTPTGGKGRLARLCSHVRDKLRSACRAGAEQMKRVGQAALIAWRLAGARVRAALLAGAGVAAAGAAWLARTSLAAAAHRLCAGTKDLAGRAWGACRRALPALGPCAT
jgi:hypothetical protein